MRVDLKVYSASLVGTGAPVVNLIFDNLEPLLKALVLMGQAGVAFVTILYIYSKWKNSRKGPPKDNDEESE